MCWYDTFPDITWFSGSDISEPDIGLECRKVINPPHESFSGFARLFNLLRKLQDVIIP